MMIVCHTAPVGTLACGCFVYTVEGAEVRAESAAAIQTKIDDAVAGGGDVEIVIRCEQDHVIARGE